MLENAGEVAIMLAEVAMPPISPLLNAAIKAVEIYKGYADRVLTTKLYRVLVNQDSDFEEWLKLTENFDKGNANYEKTVCKLVYMINAINEIELLDVYSNLLRSYKLGMISKSKFFKLTWILSSIYSEDLFQLKEMCNQKRIQESQETITLRNMSLLDSVVITGCGESSVEYSITALGLDMLQYGVDIDNAEKYKMRRKELMS